MLARVFSAAIQGIEALPISVEVDLTGGLPAVNMVGLPDAATRESRERVRSAIQNSGFSFPPRRITVNLAPAHLRKEGTALDLPVAVGILIGSGALPPECASGLLLAGELSLDGGVRRIKGALSFALTARRASCRGIVLPAAVAAEASAVEGIPVYPVTHLIEVVSFLRGETRPDPLPPLSYEPAGEADGSAEDFADVCGQAAAKRAVEVAAAGGHNLLMVGPPGAGKTMLARRIRGILPPLDRDEAIETTRIHSAAGLEERRGLLRHRPFRAPHHSISSVGLVGGGVTPRPGEASLAHHGVLFLDEVPEFKRSALEALRQPMEEGRITLTRSMHVLVFPARFVLVGAMNPCPCGQLGNPARECICTPIQVRNYRGRISGPLLDRFDLHLEVPRTSARDLERSNVAEPSSKLRQRVGAARQIQLKRFSGTGTRVNAEMSSEQIREHCAVDADGRRLLSSAVEHLGLSARAHQRILKVARTLADLGGEGRIAPAHVAEAIQYRVLDRWAS